jgi:hypothetical protein
MAVEKLKRHISPGTDQIPAQFIKVGSKSIVSEIYKLVHSIRRKEELPEE